MILIWFHHPLVSDFSSASINVNYNANSGTATSPGAAGGGNGAKTMELQALAIYWDAIEETDMLGNRTLGELAVK